VPALPVNIAVANAIATRIAVSVLSGEGWERFFEHGEQRGRGATTRDRRRCGPRRSRDLRDHRA
jgi:hypothetical protein